jgi:5-methylcytosine-specific restriction endonuclease McrA
MSSSYKRIGIFTISDVLDFIGPISKNYIVYLEDGSRIVRVKMGSQRYELFKHKGTKCVRCGLEGIFFALEKDKKNTQNIHDRYHFNLYGFNEKGKEVMLTKDHIIPRSKGGSNDIGNYQTMCSKCNWDKGNKDEK